MYQVRKVHIHEGWHETVKEFDDVNGAIAYEFATELHAATMGLNSDEDMNEEHSGPFAVHITDEDGNSKWQECSRLRCPSTSITNPNLFH